MVAYKAEVPNIKWNRTQLFLGSEAPKNVSLGTEHLVYYYIINNCTYNVVIINGGRENEEKQKSPANYAINEYTCVEKMWFL